MDLFFIQAFAFLRPILLIELETRIFGLGLFDLAAVLFTILLAGSFIFRAALSREISISSIDVLLFLFSFWCISVYFVYMDRSAVQEVLKLLLPLLTYTVVKNSVRDKEQYLRTVFLLLVGLAIPLIISAALIAVGEGVQSISYWTGIPRYEGVFAGPHTLAHAATFFLIVTTLYVNLKAKSSNGFTWVMTPGKVIVIALMVMVVLYCLYESKTRTPILGLIVFLWVFLYRTNKKILIGGTIGLLIAGILSAPIIVPRFFNDFYKVYVGDWDSKAMGSNRLKIWSDNLTTFSELPIDRKLAGVGIGNKSDAQARLNFVPDDIRNSHNDYIELLMQTGLVGFVLYLTLQVLILKAILRLDGRERYVFLALFLAVSLMNFVSNSYITRFGIAQLFYLVMAYVEVSKIRIRQEDKRRWQPNHAVRLHGYSHANQNSVFNSNPKN